MTLIEEKINENAYPSIGVARAVVKRAQLGKKKEGRLLALIDEKYKTGKKTYIKKMPKTEMPVNGMVNGAAFGGGKSLELDNDLMRIALAVLGVAVKHKLTREEAFDKVRSQLHAGMG